MKRILIISSAEDQETKTLTDGFTDALQKDVQESYQVEWTNYHGLRVEFGTNRLQVFLRSSDIELRDFDFVYFKSFFRYSELAGVVATYLENTNTKFVCSELKEHIALTKLSQFSRMAVAGLPIIDTVFMLTDEYRTSFAELESKLGLPFIFKAIDGKGGDENFLINTEADFLTALDTYPDLQFVAQAFIENDCDFRMLVVGNELKLVIKRQRSNSSTHLNNTSQGAEATLVSIGEIPEDEKALCLQAAELLGREIAGVDLIVESGTNRPFILEVNSSPQVASGAFLDEKLEVFREYLKSMVA